MRIRLSQPPAGLGLGLSLAKYENIYGDDIENITKVYERFRKNMEIRDNLLKEKFHETYNIGPLFSVHCIVNGNG